MTMPHIEQRKHVFLVKTKENAKSKKVAPKKKVALELLHHRSEQISTISLMAGDNVNVWPDIELSIDPKPFCTSCHISSIKKKGWVQDSIETKGTFQMGFMVIIPATSPNSFTGETAFSDYILNFSAYLNPPKLYGREIITTEEVMDKLDMFQNILVKID